MKSLQVALALTLLPANTGLAALLTYKNVANGVWSSGISTTIVALTPSAGGTLSAQRDNRYVLLQSPAGCAGVTCQETNVAGDVFGPSTYLVLGGNGTFPLDGTWVVQNDAGSSWIGPRADQRNPTVGGSTYDNTNVFTSDSDFYVYRMVFNVSSLGLNPATAAINLSWLSDSSSNSAVSQLSHIRLCSIASSGDPVCPANTQVANSGNPGPAAAGLNSVNVTTGFTTGLMAFDFVVYNAVVGSGRNPSGLNVLINSATANTLATLPDADLQISKTDGIGQVAPGGVTAYTVVVTNLGPGTAITAPVSDHLPAQIANASWTCTASAGSSCLAASGSGSIATLVTLLPAGTAAFIVNATLSPSATASLTNTATVGAAPGATDPNLANNAATDVDAIVVPPAVPVLGLAGRMIAAFWVSLTAFVALRQRTR
jgi:uncharacterized repeat protein (TIGR01451 family)